MTLFRATNIALDSSSTSLTAGQSYVSGAKLALQLNIPDNQVIRICEFGWAQDVATATSTLLKLETSDSSRTTTAGTALSTTLVKPLCDRDGRASSLTYSTTTGEYNNVALTSSSGIRDIEALYVPQVYVKQWPLGQWPIVGSGTAENFVAIVVNTTATVNAICWIVWDEA